MKLSSDGGDSGSSKYQRGYGGVHGGVCRSLRLAGIWSQSFGFVLVRSEVTVRMFSHLIYFIEKCRPSNFVLSLTLAKMMLQ
jgi:hypothetical protein